MLTAPKLLTIAALLALASPGGARAADREAALLPSASLVGPTQLRLERVAGAYYKVAIGDDKRPLVTAQGGRLCGRYEGEAELGSILKVSGWLELGSGTFGFQHSADLRFRSIPLPRGASVAFLVRGGFQLFAAPAESRAWVEPVSSGAVWRMPIGLVRGAGVRVSLTGGPSFALGSGVVPGPAANATAGLLW